MGSDESPDKHYWIDLKIYILNLTPAASYFLPSAVEATWGHDLWTDWSLYTSKSILHSVAESRCLVNVYEREGKL